MKVIILKNVPNLGHEKEIVEVAEGFFNNYLLPRGLAEVANSHNKKRLEETIKQTLHKEKKVRRAAEDIAEDIQDLTLKIPVKTDGKGNIFGTVTAVQISMALQSKKFEITAQQITNFKPVKELGNYRVSVCIYKDIEAELSFDLVSDTPAPAKKPAKRSKGTA